MTKQTTGPNRMRKWADYIEQNVRHHLLPLAVKNPDALRELAAQWDADLSARDHAVDLAGINAEAANELERRADRAEAAMEQARALLAEQAEIITANVWHIPPEYSARNIVLDAAAKMRDLAALLAAAPEGK